MRGDGLLALVGQRSPATWFTSLGRSGHARRMTGQADGLVDLFTRLEHHLRGCGRRGGLGLGRGRRTFLLAAGREHKRKNDRGEGNGFHLRLLVIELGNQQKKMGSMKVRHHLRKAADGGKIAAGFVRLLRIWVAHRKQLGDTVGFRTLQHRQAVVHKQGA